MKQTIMKAVVILLVIAGVYCGWRYYGDVIEPEQKIAEADNAQKELFSSVKPDISAQSPTKAYESQSEPIENILAPAKEVNENTTAWLTIPGTHIDYPVVQGEDNDFYLHHGFDGQLNQELGCPFLDCRCEADFSGFNSIVYAHHMTKQRMFADIALFKDENFMHSCPVGYLTSGNNTHTVEFFAYLTVPSDSSVYQTVFTTDSEKKEYIECIFRNAVYSTDIDINEKSRLLLLSTCTFEYEEARGVLVGVIE